MQVTGRRRACDDRAPAPGHVNRGAEGITPWMLKDDIHVLAAYQVPDALAEPPPFAGILGLLVRPETVILGAAVYDCLRSHLPADLGSAGAGHHADRKGAAD